MDGWLGGGDGTAGVAIIRIVNKNYFSTYCYCINKFCKFAAD